MTDTAQPLRDGFIHTNIDPISPRRKRFGRWLIGGASALFALTIVLQIVDAAGFAELGFVNWRPAASVCLVGSVACCAGQILVRGEAGWRALFILPAALFTVAIVIFPTLFGLSIAMTDWNLASTTGARFSGLNNLFQAL